MLFFHDLTTLNSVFGKHAQLVHLTASKKYMHEDPVRSALTFSSWKWDTSNPQKEGETKMRYTYCSRVPCYLGKLCSEERKHSTICCVCTSHRRLLKEAKEGIHCPAGLLTTGTAYALGNVHSPGLLTFLLSSSRRPVDKHSLCTSWLSFSPGLLLTEVIKTIHLFTIRMHVDKHSLCTDYHSVQASCWQKQWTLFTVPHACWQTRMALSLINNSGIFC